MALSSKLVDWFKPKPLTEEDQQMELLSSRIVEPHSEFSEEDQKKVLQELNLGTRYDGRTTDA